MRDREEHPCPPPWADIKKSLPRTWKLPLYRADWSMHWLAHYLSRWAFLKVLEYLGTFSVLIAVIFYFTEAGDRRKQKHYQAWQVINTAQGKGGSGGRIEALQELNMDHEPLVGVDASEAFLQGIKLPKAHLLRCDLHAADLRDSQLAGSNMEFASLNYANFRHSDLANVNLRDADLADADLLGAKLSGADLSRADLSSVDLRYSDLKNIRWAGIRTIEAANVYGARNAPPGFIEWALQHKAISVKGDE